MKRMRLVLWGVVGSLVILSMLGVACSPPPPAPPPKPSPSASPSPTPAPAPAPSPSAAPSPQVKMGGTLRMVINGPPAGFDMHRRPSYGPCLGMPVFNNLVRFDAMKVDNTDPANLKGDLAERWEVSADGKTITFFLRKGVKWHDGKDFTADDVVYSLEKMVDPKRSTIAQNLAALDKVAKVDDYTVRAQLRTVSNSFILQLGAAYAVIMPKHKADVDFRSIDLLVGTGPFKYKTSVSGVSYELVKNPDYFEKGLPYLDGLMMQVIADRSAQIDAFTTNRVDMTSPTGGMVNQEQLDRMKAQTQGKDIVLQEQRTPYGPATWFNNKSKPMDDARVRRAMMLVVDREKFGIASMGSLDWHDNTHWFFPPAWGLPTKELMDLSGWGRPFDDRLAEAKKLMADAGYAGGFKLFLPVMTMPEAQRATMMYGDTWKRYLNIEPDMKTFDPMVLMQMRTAGDFGTIIAELQPFVADPDEFVGYLKTGSPVNFSGYSNPAMDKLIDQQTVELDRAKRKQMVQDIERTMIKDAVASPGSFSIFKYATWPYVKNFQIQMTGYGSNLTYKHIWMDK